MTSEKLHKTIYDGIKRDLEELIDDQDLEISKRLPKALKLAEHLQREEAISWIRSELFGYDLDVVPVDQVLAYRHVSSMREIDDLKWEDEQEILITEKISDIEDILKNVMIGEEVLSRPIDPECHITVKSIEAILSAVNSRIIIFAMDCLTELEELQDSDDFKHSCNLIEDILTRFHEIVEFVAEFTSERKINLHTGESEVKNLLMAFLTFYFDRIRSESFSKSYTGKHDEIPSFIVNDTIVIEVIRTTQGMNCEQIKKEFIKTIYHINRCPTCRGVYLFVYDPEKLIENTEELEVAVGAFSKKKCFFKAIVNQAFKSN